MAKFSMSVFQEASVELRHPVELNSVELSRVKVRSSRKLPIGSKVRFRFGQRSAEGVVEKCKPDHSRFLLEVQVINGTDWLLDMTNITHRFDPGPLTLDKCMTGEQLSQLMAQMSGRSHTAS